LNACRSCSAGSFSNGVDLSSCVSEKEFTWLFRDPANGYYYITMPTPAISVSNYGTPYYTTWTKVRINSTLSLSMSQIQLFVQALDNPFASCVGKTVDAKYAVVPVQPDAFADFGTVSECYFLPAAMQLSLTGTPFSIVQQTAAWTGLQSSTCNFLTTVSASCASMQDCSVSISGDCGFAAFSGLLGVYNVGQFMADIQRACVLYGNDPNLLCSGNMGMCNDSCTACVAGTYSAAGASSCQLCPVGYFSNTTGAPHLILLFHLDSVTQGSNEVRGRRYRD